MKKDHKSSRIVAMAAGPHTVPGKKRSRRNALSHGIFAKELLLEDERPEDFSLLCRRLQADLHAEDAFEQCLVQHLAMLLWRKWRFLKAEAAIIASIAEVTKLDRVRQQLELVCDCADNLTSLVYNPLALQRSIELLSNLREDFERRGFDRDQDLAILGKLYGFSRLEEGFPYSYFALAAPDEDPDKRDDVSRQVDRKKAAVKLIADELIRLNNLKAGIEELESRRGHLTALAALIPNTEVQERLQRYDVHLSREIDRVLGQFEQYRRVRLGLPSLPAIKVTRA